MLDTDIWEKLDALQKETVERHINEEWQEIQVHVQERLMKAAKAGARHISVEVGHKPNALRLQTMIIALQNFTCDVMSAQAGSFKVNIRF